MKQINVSVIGLSGTEKEKGQMGVGKSCLCNRFIHPLTDDYFIDHISVLSQTDFSGRVINNDHFLYWGEAKKSTDEGAEYNFTVVEQTEFIDDSTFQPFKVGKMETYLKRCTAIKVASAEKLMYICKNQLGIEKEYEQKVLPEGRLGIDGFVCVFDVSPVPNRSVEKQVEFVHAILMNVLKTKKPVVLVTTKNDDANEAYVREAEKICQRKEYKGQVQLVETSSHESINIDLAFILLAQLIDKTKNRTKITSYHEAAFTRKELLDTRTEAVTRLIRTQITDYHTLWTHGSKQLAKHKEWIEFLELFGQEAGQRIFRRHMKKLRDDHLNKRLQHYMDNFASTLQDIVPDISTLNIQIDDDWNLARNYLKSHLEFDQYFFECDRAQWTDLSDLSDLEDEQRIPFDVLETSEAETVFKNHVNALQQEQKRLEWKKQFKKLLEETGYVTPGKQLSEVRVLFMGRECFEALSEHDCQQIYDNHQREIIEKAKHNFLELLLEHADLFQHFKNIEPTGTITQDDIKEITEVLQDDIRYKLLDRLDQDRKLMLFQHLGFVHCPIREHCPAFPNCMDSLIERIMAGGKTSNLGIMTSSQWKSQGTESLLNLLIMGSEHLASDLLNDIRISCGSDGEYIYDNQTYFLNYRIVNGDMESFKSIDFQSSGLICVYSNQQSFETLKDNLERSLLCNLELEDKFENLPIVLVYQPHDLKESEIDYLRSEGQRLATMLHCEFIDTMNFYRHRQSQHQNHVYDILNHLINCIRLAENKSNEMVYQPPDQPDLRIILAMFCGDPFSIDAILNPLMSESSCITPDKSIMIDAFLGDSKRRIEFIITSYHGANQYRDDLIHGFILFYSTKRRSSLANLNAFTMNIPNMPIQIIAITESGGANAFFNNDLCQLLITEGNSIADRFRAHFMTSSVGQPLKFAFYLPFLKKVWDRKPEIEQIHMMEEPITLDSGEGTLEHSVRHHLPQPPPRHESYMLKSSGTGGTDGSGSENYEHLPTRSLNSLNGEKDCSLEDDTCCYGDDDKDDKARLLHQGFQIYPPPTTPPEPAPPDHHMAPSSLMRQFKGNLVSASQSSLDEITSDVSGSKDSLTTHDSGWLDDALFTSRDAIGNKIENRVGGRSNIIWNNFGNTNHHSFTTGRQRNESSNFSNKIRPKGPSQTLKQPGKINLKNFQIVSDAVARMNINSDSNMAEGDNLNSSKSNNVKNNPSINIFPNIVTTTTTTTTTSVATTTITSITTNTNNSISLKKKDNIKKLLFNNNSNNIAKHKQITPSQPPPPLLPPSIQKNHNLLLKNKLLHPNNKLIITNSILNNQLQNLKFNNAAYSDIPATAATSSISSNLNLINDSITTSSTTKSLTSMTTCCPLAAPEDDSDEMAEYAQIKDYADEGKSTTTSTITTKKTTPINLSKFLPPPPSISTTTITSTIPNTINSSSTKIINCNTIDTPSKSKFKHRRDNKDQKYSESDSDTSSSERKARGYDGYYKMNRKPQTHKRPRKKRTGIPVQPPKVPSFGGTFVSPPEIPLHYQKMKTLEKAKSVHVDVQEEESSIDASSPRDNNSPIFGVMSKITGENERDKLLDLKQKQKTWKEEEKLEKRRLKEEQAKLRKLQDKEKEQEKKSKRKSKQQNNTVVSGKINPTETLESALSSMPEFMQSDKQNNIPIFLTKCVQFIELEGLDSEGIYRVPGNRAHVDLLFQKFEEDPNVDVESLDIPVNAVATALKDFFSKRLPSLFDKDLMRDLEEIAGSRGMSSTKLSMEVKTDRSCRLIALRALLNKLPPLNFAILKFIFQHFVRVSENSKLNSMDSKNLAICWWPTLIPIEFTDMGHFEQLRPYLEDIVQTMIDQFPYLFCGKEAFVMV